MSDPTAVATAVLICCVVITVLLGKTKLFGTLTVTGFVLGSLATAALFVLLS
jgi:hypothetical protein